MRIRNEAKVGIIVFAGILALIVVYWFLGGLGLRASMYPLYAVFDNVQRLQKGAEVRMSGVDIGLVTRTTLTRRAKARVDLLIDESVPIPDDSVARVTTGAFIGEYYVEIRPGRSTKMLHEGGRIKSERSTTPDELVEGASRVLKTLQGSARGINALLSEKQLPKAIKDTVAYLNRAAKSAAELLSTASALVRRVSPDVAAAIAGAKQASRSAAAFSADLEQTMRKDV
ncbi:MAG: MlaD family protein, partial [Armatimonadota bacterium]